jgi:hypothetical protein
MLLYLQTKTYGAGVLEFSPPSATELTMIPPRGCPGAACFNVVCNLMQHAR